MSFKEQLKDLKSNMKMKSKEVTFKEPIKENNTTEENNVSNTNITEQPLSFEMDRNFLSWIAKNKVSFLITSYKTNNVYSIGAVREPKSNELKLSIYMTAFSRPMGLHIHNNNDIYISTMHSLWKYVNIGETDDNETGIEGLNFDKTFMPRVSHITNDVDGHDITVDENGEVYFISATYCTICKPSETHSFEVFWKPPWISKVAREDRCHLNGLCNKDGKIKYASSVSQTNIRSGWREKNRKGLGVVIDVETNEIVCDGLTMPHSPRWHDGKLWVLNAGCGEFGYIDFENKKFIPKVFIAGFLRGLDFVGNKYAVIGSSLDRHEKCFMNLPLGEELKKLGGGKEENAIDPICGLHIVDLKTFDVIHELKFTGQIVEIYDVGVLKNTRRPKLLGIYDETIASEHSIKNKYE